MYTIIRLIAYFATTTSFLLPTSNSAAIFPRSHINPRADTCAWPVFPQPTDEPPTHPNQGDPGTNQGYDEPDTPSTLPNSATQRAAKRANGNLNSDGAPGQTLSTSSGTSHTSEALGPEAEYRDAVRSGAILWNRLQHTLATPAAQLPVAPCIDLTTHWRAFSPSSVEPEHFLSTLWPSLLPHMVTDEHRTPDAPSLWHYVELLNPRPPAYLANFYYNNLYAPALHTLVAVALLGRVSGSPSARAFNRPGDPAPPTQAPDRWSDVSWSYWNSACAAERAAGRDGDVSKLQWVLQQRIRNARTNAVIDRLLGSPAVGREDAVETRKFGYGYGKSLVRTLTPDGDGEEFLALVRTPNVVGTVHMLMDYRGQLGSGGVGRTIKSVLVVRTQDNDWPGGYFLAVELEDADVFEDASGELGMGHSSLGGEDATP